MVSVTNFRDQRIVFHLCKFQWLCSWQTSVFVIIETETLNTGCCIWIFLQMDSKRLKGGSLFTFPPIQKVYVPFENSIVDYTYNLNIIRCWGHPFCSFSLLKSKQPVCHINWKDQKKFENVEIVAEIFHFLQFICLIHTLISRFFSNECLQETKK